MEIHGAKGAIGFGISNILFNTRRWTLRLRRSVFALARYQNTSAANNTFGMQFSSPGYGDWSASADCAMDDVSNPIEGTSDQLDVLNRLPANLQLMDPSGRKYEGSAWVTAWEVDNDRFGLSLLRVEFAGNGQIKQT